MRMMHGERGMTNRKDTVKITILSHSQSPLHLLRHSIQFALALEHPLPSHFLFELYLSLSIPLPENYFDQGSETRKKLDIFAQYKILKS